MIKKVCNTYKNLSVVAKASLWFLFCTMFQKCLAILTTPIFTRIMDSDQYGYFSTYLSITTILTVVLTLNFDSCAYMNGIVKFENEAEKKQLATSLLSFTVLLTLSIGAITFLLRDPLSKALKLPSALILLMIIEILFIPPVKFWMVKQRFAYKYISVVAVTLGMLIVNNLLGIILVLNSTSNQAVFRVMTIALVQFIAGITLYIYYIKQSGFFRLTKYWKYGLKLNLPLVPHGLSIVILSSSDRVMINSMVGATQAGIYGVAYSVGLIINSIKLSLVDAVKPWIYEKLKKREFGDISKVCNLIFLLNILMTFIIIGIAPEIIKFFAPPKYSTAVYIVPPVAASSYFTFIYNICSIVELYYERNKRIMIASVLAAVINVILNYIFIPIYGFIAAGYTTLVSYIILSLLHFIFLNCIRKEEMNDVAIINVKSSLLLSVLVLGGMIAFTYLYAYTVARIVVVLVILLICYIYRNKFIDLLKSVKKVKKRVE